MANIEYVGVHCLEHIFDHLDLDDLLNVADTSRWLRSVAYASYARKYGKKCVVVRFLRINHTEPQFGIEEECVKVNCFAKHLQILRCFGKRISKLKIEYLAEIPDRRAVLDHYFSEYCAASEIKIYGNATNARCQISANAFQMCNILNCLNVMLPICHTRLLVYLILST